MDKGRRNELRQLKYRNRVQNIIHGIDGSRRTMKQAVAREVEEEVGYMDESLDEELMWEGGFESGYPGIG
jgi:hypothetical protein